MNWVLLIILLVVNAPVYLLLGKWLFGGWDDFGEAIVFWIKPDFFSAIDGELGADWWAEIKLGIFIAACGGLIYGEYHYISSHFL